MLCLGKLLSVMRLQKFLVNKRYILTALTAKQEIINKFNETCSYWSYLEWDKNFIVAVILTV
jgi:hypothetical protein